MKSAGVVVIYNPDKSVIDNIDTYINFVDKLYIVDNSEDKNEYMICALNEKYALYDIEYISLNGNMGIAKAINVSIEKAIEDGFDWLLTMDQDSRFKNNIIGIYYDYIKHNKIDDIAILSPLYITDRNKEKSKGKIEEKYWTMQSANFVNLRALKNIGLYEERYFIDCVDYEYCVRARKKGYRIIRCNKAVLEHSPGITKQIRFGIIKYKYGYASPLRIYYQVRNALFMFKKYKNIKALQIVLIKLGKIILLFDDKMIYFKAVKCALDDFKKGYFGKKELDKLNA